LAIEKSSGKLLIGGLKNFDEIVVTRIHTNGFGNGSFGTLGETFYETPNMGEYYEVRHMNLDKTDKIILTGKYYATQGITFSKTYVVRLSKEGIKDNTFGTNGMALYNSSSVNYDEGRKIYANTNNDYYIIGATYKLNLDWDYSLLKIKNNAIVDNTFDTDGWKLYNLGGTSDEEYLLNGAMMQNGNLLLTGNQGSGDTVYFSMLMVKPDGTPEPIFATNGIYKHIFGVNNNNSSAGLALSDDGKIYLGGYTRTCANGTCGPLYAGISRYFGGQIAAPNQVTEIFNTNNISIFPNYVAAQSWTELSGSNAHHCQLIAFNIIGEHIKIQRDNTKFKLLHAAPGLYNIMVIEKNKKPYTLKLIQL
jgi:hypothetical protein